MKKVLSLIMVCFLFLLVGCGSKQSSLESTTYSMEQNGVKLSMEIKYDKDKNVQETYTKNTYDYEKLGMDKKQMEEYLKNNSSMYKNMKGVKQTIKYGDKEATETLKVTVKDVSKESLPVLFSINANDNGTVSLDTLTKNFEKAGFKKE